MLRLSNEGQAAAANDMIAAGLNSENFELVLDQVD